MSIGLEKPKGQDSPQESLGHRLAGHPTLHEHQSDLRSQRHRIENGPVAENATLATALLLKTLHDAETNIDGMKNLTWLQKLKGHRKPIQTEIHSLARSAEALYRHIRSFLKHERPQGMIEQHIQDENRATVGQILSDPARGIAETDDERDQLRFTTIGLLGDRIKQAEYLNDVDIADQTTLEGLHRTLHAAWEQCKRLKSVIPAELQAEFTDLQNRLHTLCGIVEDRLPADSRRALHYRHTH